MNLKTWLIELAAGFNFELKAGLVKQYLKILGNWRLTVQQWESLNARALLRHDYFPKISQLYEIACELLAEAEVKANSELIQGMQRSQQRSGSEQPADTSNKSGGA